MPANATESNSRSWTPKAERDRQQVDGQQVSETASPVDRSPMLDASMATSPGTEDEEPLSIKMPGRYRFRRFSMPTRPASFAANETFSSYLEALHDHLPLSMTYTLGNLRDALLGYLSEAESAVRDGLAGDRETVMASETPPSDERDTTAPTATQAGITGLGLRRRGAALQRRLSGGIQAPAFPSSEALLAHLASIREDVAASLPEMPTISSISSLSTPSLPIPSMTAFLQTLPNRLHYLQEHLPASGQPDKERVARLVRSLLPSEDWAGWETLGWDAGDDESDTGIVPNSEEEEPEYLFPNKTPRAAMNRMQSYAARSRSKSASYTAAALRQSRSLQELRTATSADLLRLDSEKGSVVLGDTDIEDLGSEQLDEEEMLLLQEQLQVSAQVGPTAQEVLAKSQHGKILIKYDDLPPWMQNNEFIVTGYRFIPLHPKTGPIPLLSSIFKWHNETVNIHSHLLPTVFLLSLVIPYTLFYPPLHNPAPLDILTLLAFMLAAVSCLISSAGWHLLSGCSKRSLFEWGACVDYVGISWLISCSIHTVYYNGFYCQGGTLLVYTVTTLASATAGSILPFQRWFNERRYKKYRIAFFLGICLTALAPLSHLAFVHGFKEMLQFSAPIYPSIAAYVCGLVFYAFHYPESKWPGKFDYIGASHQIWHLSILFGIYLHYTGTLQIFDGRHTFSCALEGAGRPMSSYFRGIWPVNGLFALASR